jgi:GNAT superfamily N-acetyltransferase
MLKDFSPRSIDGMIERGAVEGIAAMSAWPELRLHEENDVLWTLTDIPYPVLNCVMRLRLPLERSGKRIDAILGAARERGVPMLWFVGPLSKPSDLEERLKAKGLVYGGSAAGMAVDLGGIGDAAARMDDLSIEEVLDIEALGDWLGVVVTGFQMPQFTASAWLGIYRAMGFGEGSRWRHFLARLDGKPAATSSLFGGFDTATIGSVTTLPDSRNRGLGTAVTMAALHEAQRNGYRIATLWASKKAVGVYRRIGFSEYGEIKLYLSDCTQSIPNH